MARERWACLGSRCSGSSASAGTRASSLARFPRIRYAGTCEPGCNNLKVAILEPGRPHAGILFGLLERLGVTGNLTTDAHLAALAIEYQAELHSSDADFSRFPGLRWRNPLR